MFNSKVTITQEQINTALEPMISQILKNTNNQMQQNKEIMINKINILENQIKELIKEEITIQIKNKNEINRTTI